MFPLSRLARRVKTERRGLREVRSSHESKCDGSGGVLGMDSLYTGHYWSLLHLPYMPEYENDSSKHTHDMAHGRPHVVTVGYGQVCVV